MPTLIIAGDATTGLVQSAAVDGALTIQSGPAGAKVNAIALSSTGTATFNQITGGALTLATTQATTSGTAIDFTSIPSWVRRITVMFQGVSTNGTSIPQLQLGTGATPTYVTSGYVGTFSYSGGGGGTFTTGIGISASTAANIRSGSVIITSMGSNVWTAMGVVGLSDAAITSTTGASISLGAVLTAIRLTTVSGADTFDAGSVNIMYEG